MHYPAVAHVVVFTYEVTITRMLMHCMHIILLHSYNVCLGVVLCLVCHAIRWIDGCDRDRDSYDG